MWTKDKPLEFIHDYLCYLDEGLKAAGKGRGLSRTQKKWIGFCLMGILLTSSICWAKFERMSFMRYTQQALSWMFRKSKVPWDRLLKTSVLLIIRKFGISSGYLVIDDKDINRSKNAKKLHHLHKMKDKKTGGYTLGQNVVFLYFITGKVSLPVGFSFYCPDPVQKKWRSEMKLLRKKGVPKKLLPKQPKQLADYPKKYELAIELLKDFKSSFPMIKVSAVLADCLYGHLPFMQGVEDLWNGIQIITKMRKNQNVRWRMIKYQCSKYFTSYRGWKQKITIRGRESKTVVAGGARLYVPSHHVKRFVIAMRYEGETEPRYLMASDLSWNMKQIMEAFSMRWLIEVFFEDWSGHHGFCSLAKQCGEEGSLRPLTLSLLFDHCFLFHKDQSRRLKHNQPLATFGSLVEKSRAMAWCQSIQDILKEPDPKAKLLQLVDSLEEVYPLRPSKKHFNGVACESIQKVA